jgi:hypothetical protein
MTWKFKTTSLLTRMAFHQVCTRSGKVYGPLHPEWLEITESIADRIQVALRAPIENDTLPMKNIRRLLLRLGEMVRLSREGDYWFVTIPEILRKILDNLFDIDEFWVPTVIRDLISTIEGLRGAQRPKLTSLLRMIAVRESTWQAQLPEILKEITTRLEQQEATPRIFICWEWTMNLGTALRFKREDDDWVEELVLHVTGLKEALERITEGWSDELD